VLPLLDMTTRGVGLDHARLRPPGPIWRAARKQDERAGVGVRHCGKFPNAPVAPLRAGRQRKPLWLLQWCRTF